MSRKKSKKPGSQPVQTVVAQTLTPHPEPIPAKGGLWALLKSSQVPAIIAITISLGSVWYSKRQSDFAKEQADAGHAQAETARQTLDIATGKRQAKIEQVDFFPKFGDYKNEDIGEFGDKEGFKQPFFRTTNSMVLMAPAIFFNNIGDEPIDAVRVEVSFVGGIVDRTFDNKNLLNPPKEWYKNDTPVILRAAHTEETLLPRPWRPDESLRLVVLKGVIDQITQVQSKTTPDRLHLAELSIVVSARIAGSNIFSGTTPVPLLYKVAWKPDGFPEDEVKRLRDGYIPSHLFSQKRAAVIPTQYMQNQHRGSFNDRPSFDRPIGK